MPAPAAASQEDALIDALLLLITAMGPAAGPRPPGDAARIAVLEAELATAYDTVSRLIAQKRALQRKLDAELRLHSAAPAPRTRTV